MYELMKLVYVDRIFVKNKSVVQIMKCPRCENEMENCLVCRRRREVCFVLFELKLQVKFVTLMKIVL